MFEIIFFKICSHLTNSEQFTSIVKKNHRKLIFENDPFILYFKFSCDFLVDANIKVLGKKMKKNIVS